MKLRGRTVQMKEQYIFIPASTRERFLNSPPPPLPFLLNNDIEWIGLSNATNGFRADRHDLKTHFILYTTDGHGYVRIGNRPYQTLQKGTVLIAPAISEYSYWTDRKWDIMWAHLFTGSIWNKLIGKEVQLRKAVWADNLEREMESYLAEMHRFRTDSVRALHSHVDLIVLYLQRELEKNHPRTTAAHRALEAVWNEVRGNLSYPWEIRDLANLAHMSRSALYRAAKNQTGHPPLEIVHSMRMEHAGTLLLHTDYTLGVIAEKIGYNNQFSFSCAFKRYTGQNPSQFRETRPSSTRAMKT
jgi:AraC-like DNA-binding protein